MKLEQSPSMGEKIELLLRDDPQTAWENLCSWGYLRIVRKYYPDDYPKEMWPDLIVKNRLMDRKTNPWRLLKTLDDERRVYIASDGSYWAYSRPVVKEKQE